MKRLFTFGCSHTNHYWHSWADILGLGFDKYYNFGKAGTGNFRILNQVQRANEYFEFTKDDYIAVCLSSDFRYDTIDVHHSGWIQNGCMVDERGFYTEHLAKQLDWIGGYENTLTCIKGVKSIINTTSANLRIVSAFGYDIIPYKKPAYNRLMRTIFLEIQKNLHSPTTFHNLPTLTNYDSLTYAISDKKGGTTLEDGHFTIPIHLDFVKEHFSDWYDDKHDTKVMNWHKNLPMHTDGKGGMTEYYKDFVEKYTVEFNGPILVGRRWNNKWKGFDRIIVEKSQTENSLL